MKRLLPRSLLGQLALLIIIALLLAQIVSFWLFDDARGAALRAVQWRESIERTVALARALEAADAGGRQVILAAADSRLVNFSVDVAPLVSADLADQARVRSQIPALADAPAALLVEEAPVQPRRADGPGPPPPVAWLMERLSAAGLTPVELRLSYPLQDAGWLNVRSSLERADIRVPPVILGTMLLSLGLIVGAVWFGLRQLTGPLRQLSAAADGFGIDAPLPPMPKGGPREVRVLAEALSRMHERVSGVVLDRTRMLVSLGHDLRSPITALRVRAELVDDEETRERLVSTLEEMQQMVEATLAYARGVSSEEPTQPVELNGLLAQLVDEVSDAGPGIAFVRGEAVVANIREVPMRRALRNLLVNAQRYGGGARVSLGRTTETCEIMIDDDGPGIPDADLERVFEPFVRLEASRSPDTGGIGLGLPIARAIVRAHGGDVRLANRGRGGLRATVMLPVASEPGNGKQHK